MLNLLALLEILMRSMSDVEVIVVEDNTWLLFLDGLFYFFVSTFRVVKGVVLVSNIVFSCHLLLSFLFLPPHVFINVKNLLHIDCFIFLKQKDRDISGKV